jgi:hypothetical protein
VTHVLARAGDEDHLPGVGGRREPSMESTAFIDPLATLRQVSSSLPVLLLRIYMT